jgi:hypothetical protein
VRFRILLDTAAAYILQLQDLCEFLRVNAGFIHNRSIGI